MKIIFAVIALAFTFIVVDLVPNSSLVSQAHAVTKAQKKQAWADCRKIYGKTIYKVRVKKNGEVRCHYRRNASTRKNPTSHAEATKLCKKIYKGVGPGLRAVRKGGNWICMYRN